jgi:hypothetical protein
MASSTQIIRESNYESNKNKQDQLNVKGIDFKHQISAANVS